METSTCDPELIRHGKEWFEHCMARSIVYWTSIGGRELRIGAPAGWAVKLSIWPFFRSLTGKYEYKPEFQSVEESYALDAENYRRAVQWLVAKVPARHVVQINFSEIKEVFMRIPASQQRRIVEILYERYSS